MVKTDWNAGDLGWIPGSGRPPGVGNGNSYSSILAWRIPLTEEPGRLQSMGSQGSDTTAANRRKKYRQTLLSTWLKLKLQYFGHLMWRTDSFEKTLMLEKIEGRRRRGRQRMRWLDGITHSVDMGLSKLGDGQGGLVCCSPWGNKESDTTEQLSWTGYKTVKSI